MTTLSAFPTNLPGLGYDVLRTPQQSTRVLTTRSGREYRAANWTFGRYKYTLTFNVLRTQSQFTEFQTLLGFINQMQGMYGTFAYTDPYDNAVTLQGIGTGDGVTKIFPLVRAFGGYVEPVLNATAITQVQVSGSNVTAYTGIQQGAYGTDSISFTSAPASNAPITASFTYSWPCRFLNDENEFNNFASNRWGLKKLEFTTVK